MQRRMVRRHMEAKHPGALIPMTRRGLGALALLLSETLRCGHPEPRARRSRSCVLQPVGSWCRPDLPMVGVPHALGAYGVQREPS